MIFFDEFFHGIEKKPYITKILLGVLLLVFLVQAGTSMFYKSAAWDETTYFGLGKYLLTRFKWDVPGSILHPPFDQDGFQGRRTL